MLRAILAEASHSFWMPERASTIAPGTDWLFNGIMYLTYFFTGLIAVGAVVFTIKYRHRKGVQRDNTSAGHSTALELTWTIIPTIIVIIIYYYGFRQFLNQAVEPPNAYEIVATGRMWNWSFTYPNGHIDAELHVPANTPVRVVLKSEDVIHSLFIPAFRIKKDVVPGRFNRIWFEATKDQTGPAERHDIYCAAYCGINHSIMLTKAFVHDPDDFPKWLEDVSDLRGKLSSIQIGAAIYTSRGCAQCHSVNGSRITGPTWKDMYGSMVPIEGGQTVLADATYITESIENPSAKIHAGYPNVMPSFKGAFKDYELAALIAYMESISVNFKGDLGPLNQIVPKPGGKVAPSASPGEVAPGTRPPPPHGVPQAPSTAPTTRPS